MFDLAHFAPDIKAAFHTYCVADVQAAYAGKSLETLNVNELQLMLSDAGLVEGNVTVARVESIFVAASAQLRASAEPSNEEAAALDFDEFCVALAMVCDAKVPETARGEGEPFEVTLHAWLQLSFLPTMRRVLKRRSSVVASRSRGAGK